MRARSLPALLMLILSLGVTRVALADGKSDVAAKIKAAMEAYDTFDYDGAKKQLTAAIAAAKKAHLDKDPILAKAYLDLGIVDAAVPDQDAAKQAFVSAVQIDAKIQIDVAYKSPELAKLLDSARSDAKSSTPVATPTSNDTGGLDLGTDCTSIKGLEHTLVDTAKGNAPLTLETNVGTDVKAAKVSIFYRVEGSTEFSEVKMIKAGECKYAGQIPASAMKGSLVHYYIGAYDGGGKVIASKGSQGSPNIIEVTAGAAGSKPSDNEDPLGGSKTTTATPSGDDSASVSADTSAPGKPKKIYIGLNAGTSAGYVTGTTEGMNAVKNCCIGSSLVVLVGEIGYHITPRTAIGLAFRFGVPVGANLEGHATGAPAGLVRLRHSFSDDGGFHVMGQLGVGFLRNTIKLDDPANGMDTDIVAQGPLLVGAGVGYEKKLGDMVAFVVDLDAIAGIAVTSQIGASPLNSGISGDLSLGFQFGF